MPRLPLLGALGAVLMLALAASPAQAAGRHVLPGRRPAFVGASGTTDLGAATGAVHAIISLRHRDQAGLERFIAAVSDPANAAYGHYLTPQQFDATYAPSDADVAQVEDFARGNGLQVGRVPANHAYVEVTGSVAAAEAAFATEIRRFGVGSRAAQAPATDISVPASLAGVVSDVSGLDTADVAHRMATPPAAYVNAPPCSTSWASSLATQAPQAYGATQPNVPCGYTPQQVQGAYGLKEAYAAGIDGTGRRVAVIDAYSSPRIESDVAMWSSNHGLPAPSIEVHDTATQRNAQEVSTPTDLPVVGGIPVNDPQGWAGEETLDVEAIHTTAPGATVVYQGAESPLNMFLQMAQNSVVSGHLADIVSNSYGGSTDDADATSDGIWQQAAAEGIGVYFSSGDAGDETAGGANPADRATDAGGNSPYVTAVGGTTLAVGAHDDYEFETYWGTFSSTLTGGAFAPTAPGEFNSGGGGGTSQAYAEPTYQQGVVPDQFARYWEHKTADEGAVDGGYVPGRVTPDVAMLADPNSGFLVGLVQDEGETATGLPSLESADSYGEYRIGGTSLSSPLFAGVMALADQAAGAPHGFANPALYAARGTGFRDITAPGAPVAVVRTNYTNSLDASGGIDTLLRTAAQTGTLTSQPGFDDSTGLGSPNGVAFLRALAPGSAVLAPPVPVEGPGDPSSPGTTTTTTSATGAPTPDVETGTTASTTGTTASTTAASAAAPAASAGSPGAPATAPATCTPPKAFRFVLHAGKHQRVVRVRATVAGRTVLARRGHRLTAVTIKRPAAERFSVVITATTNRGSVTRSSRTYTRSGCARTRVVVRHGRVSRAAGAAR